MNKKDLEKFKEKLSAEKTVIEEQLAGIGSRNPRSASGWEATSKDMEVDAADENGGGTVKNVEEWKTFDEKTDTGEHYYKITTEPKKTADGIPYEILVFYKDKAKVRDINKGEEIKVEGRFLKILNQRLILSVWIYGEELTAADKEKFK